MPITHLNASPANAGAQPRSSNTRGSAFGAARRCLQPVFAGVALGLASPVLAQSADPCVESNPPCVIIADRLAPDIVVAARVPEYRSQVGQAITTLTRDDIDRRQTTVLSDLLSTTPGVTVTRNGSIGGFTGVRIRGAEAEQTLVVIDGVRVNDPSSPGGGFDFANLLSTTVERVEILRGPNSVPWGSQAIGGVVAITTVSTGTSLRARGEGGSYGTGFGSLGGNYSAGPVHVSANAGYLTTDGVSAAANGRERDGYRQFGGSGSLSIDLTDRLGVDLRGYYAHSRTRLDGYAPPTYAFGDDAEYSTAQEVYGYAGARLDTGWGKHRLAFTIADINRDNYDPASGTDPIFFGRGRSERYEYVGDIHPVDAVRLVLGAERENSRYFDGFLRASTGITSGYGELIVKPVDALTLTGGVRRDEHDQFGGHTTFGADAALALGGTTLRGSFGEGFKAPTLYQLYSDYGTRTLRPETARNFDVGIEQTALGGALTASVTAFTRRTRNQIDFRACVGAECATQPYGLYDNIDRTRARGVEVGLELRPVVGFVVQGSYSFIDSENRSPGANLGNDLARRPHDTASVSADYRFPFGLQLGGTVQLVGDSFDDAANSTRLDSYALASVRAELPVGRRFSLYGRVENVADARYQTVAGYGTLGRAAYGGIRVKLD